MIAVYVSVLFIVVLSAICLRVIVYGVSEHLEGDDTDRDVRAQRSSHAMTATPRA
jgi:hypothetical protein